MNNQTLINTARKILLHRLSECTQAQQIKFKLMYSHKNLDISLEELVLVIDESKLDWCITQCENTINKNNNG